MKYFIGTYKLNNKQYNNIYYNCFEGWREWHKDTFSPACEDIKMLLLKIQGKDYKEKQADLEEKAIEWSVYFSQFAWSYGEIAEIQDFFYINAKRYGLVKEFKDNGII